MEINFYLWLCVCAANVGRRCKLISTQTTSRDQPRHQIKAGTRRYIQALYVGNDNDEGALSQPLIGAA